MDGRQLIEIILLYLIFVVTGIKATICNEMVNGYLSNSAQSYKLKVSLFKNLFTLMTSTNTRRMIDK